MVRRITQEQTPQVAQQLDDKNTIARTKAQHGVLAGASVSGVRG